MRRNEYGKRQRAGIRFFAAAVMAGMLFTGIPAAEIRAEETTAAVKAEETTVAAETEQGKESSAAELSDQPVRIESLGMELRVPKEWVTLTQELSPDDPIFKENGMNGEQMIGAYKEHGILLDSINKEEKVEFNITLFGEDKKITQLTQFSDPDIKVLAKDMVSPEDNGNGDKEAMERTDYKLYEHPQAKFIVNETEISKGSGNSTIRL